MSDDQACGETVSSPPVDNDASRTTTQAGAMPEGNPPSPENQPAEADSSPAQATPDPAVSANPDEGRREEVSGSQQPPPQGSADEPKA